MRGPMEIDTCAFCGKPLNAEHDPDCAAPGAETMAALDDWAGDE